MLVSPEQALDGGLSPFPCAHPYDQYSAPGMLATAAPPSSTLESALMVKRAVDMWPSFNSVRGRHCLLKPGDFLYIPPFWSSHTETLGLSPPQAPGKGAAPPDPAGPCMAVIIQLHHDGTGKLQVPSSGAIKLQVRPLM